MVSGPGFLPSCCSALPVVFAAFVLMTQDGNCSKPTFSVAGMGKRRRGGKSLPWKGITWKCYSIDSHPIGHISVTWSSVVARGAGKCSFCTGNQGPT